MAEGGDEEAAGTKAGAAADNVTMRCTSGTSTSVSTDSAASTRHSNGGSTNVGEDGRGVEKGAKDGDVSVAAMGKGAGPAADAGSDTSPIVTAEISGREVLEIDEKL